MTTETHTTTPETVITFTTYKGTIDDFRAALAIYPNFMGPMRILAVTDKEGEQVEVQMAVGDEYYNDTLFWAEDVPARVPRMILAELELDTMGILNERRAREAVESLPLHPEPQDTDANTVVVTWAVETAEGVLFTMTSPEGEAHGMTIERVSEIVDGEAKFAVTVPPQAIAEAREYAEVRQSWGGFDYALYEAIVWTVWPIKEPEPSTALLNIEAEDIPF